MMAMKKPGLLWIIAMVWVELGVIVAIAAPTPSKWEQPAAALADQIAGILGPGQAQLTIRNLSTIPTGDLPLIRKLLEQDLKAHGVSVSGAESANAIRVTLSENARERLWVAEVVEGDEARVAMVKVDAASTAVPTDNERIVLRKEHITGTFNALNAIVPDSPILAVLEANTSLIVLHPEEIAIFGFGEGGWKEQKTFPLDRRQMQGRDPRGILLATADGFAAFSAGSGCTGTFSPSPNSTSGADGWSAQCHKSDDPWPIYQNSDPNGGSTLKAFYNTARNYFTGVVTPSLGVDLPPFYSAGMLPRATGGVALLVKGVDGKVLMVEIGALKTVTGTRDWGSDFAVLRSECGGGAQVIAAGSGEAPSDSLRAYELPALEAVPASAPLPMEGTVTAMWTSQDGKSVLAVVRNAANQYEVDRVTALCN